jgi:hypothetical protein
MRRASNVTRVPGLFSDILCPWDFVWDDANEVEGHVISMLPNDWVTIRTRDRYYSTSSTNLTVQDEMGG